MHKKHPLIYKEINIYATLMPPIEIRRKFTQFIARKGIFQVYLWFMS